MVQSSLGTSALKLARRPPSGKRVAVIHGPALSKARFAFAQYRVAVIHGLVVGSWVSFFAVVYCADPWTVFDR